MASFPTTIKAFIAKINGGVVDALHINDLQDEVTALESTVGVNNSAVATTIDYKLKNASSVNPGHKHTISAINDIEVTSPIDGQGLVYESASGKFKNATTSIADASTTVKGITKLATAPVSPTNPIAVGDNDPRVPTQSENDALVGTSGTAVSSSNKLVDNADTRLAKTSAEQMYFGDSSDENVTISSNTTLTRDMFYNDLTINSGVTLNTGNFRVFVAGTLTNNNATNGITCNGGNGGNSSGGIGGTAGVAVPSGTINAGTSGASGVYNTGGGGAGGGTVFISAKTIAVQGGVQALGGNAGTSTAVNGGGVGVAGISATASVISLIQSGAGGNGGATPNGAGLGGVTGFSKNSNKNITALLNLLNGSTGQALSGGSGGGSGSGGPGVGSGSGGGQGGVIIFIYKTLTTSGTLSVAGGTGSATGGGGNNGTNGSSGIAISLQIS